MLSYEDILEAWKKKDFSTAADIDVTLNNFRVLFAYNSNCIENRNTTMHDTREIFENGKVINYTGDLRTLFELNNQKDCHEFLKPYLLRKEKITGEFIKQVHEVLMKGCYDETRYAKGERVGYYKKNDYGVGDDIGVLPEDVESEIDFICNEINGNEDMDVLTKAAYFHLNFESIHPFADGNGRVGRTLMNYYLMIHDYPPTIIYEENKDEYYMALAVFDKTEKMDGFIKFLKEQTVKTWTKKSPGLSKGIKTVIM